MKILVGYEESKVAEEALELALKHARAFKADIFIVTALEQSSELQKEDIEAVEDKLEKLIKTHNINNLVCQTYALVSYLTPGENLVEFAQENNIDEIFIGVKRRSKVGKLFFGSNAQYIILNAPCPVMTVT
jgi:nucleotide-binding universal stress UspA family protein